MSELTTLPASAPSGDAPSQVAAPVAVTAPVAAVDDAAALRAALLRAHFQSALGPVASPHIVDTVLRATSPELSADRSGLTPSSIAKINEFRAANPWVAPPAPAPAPVTAAPAAQVAPVQTPAAPTPVLPATPGSNAGATGGLSTEDQRKLSQLHIDPAAITANRQHFARMGAFWGRA